MSEMDPLKERNLQTACLNKKKYFDKKEAARASIQMELKHGIPFAPYQCKYCYFWHVGSDRRLLEGR